MEHSGVLEVPLCCGPPGLDVLYYIIQTFPCIMDSDRNDLVIAYLQLPSPLEWVVRAGLLRQFQVAQADLELSV